MDTVGGGGLYGYCRGDRVTMGAGPMDTAGGIGSPWGLVPWILQGGYGPMDTAGGIWFHENLSREGKREVEAT